MHFLKKKLPAGAMACGFEVANAQANIRGTRRITESTFFKNEGVVIVMAFAVLIIVCITCIHQAKPNQQVPTNTESPANQQAPTNPGEVPHRFALLGNIIEGIAKVGVIVANLLEVVNALLNA